MGKVDGVGIDYFIGEEHETGRGVGSRAIRSFVDATLLTLRSSESVVVAVQQANVASWRALRRASCHRVWSGVLDSDDPSDQGPAHLYERTHNSAG
jgi:RimJ/RimL family protein N-acetyltransferase